MSLAAVLCFVAASFALMTACGAVSAPASLLTLERAFPLNEKVEIEALRARDGARHRRILQGLGGVVDFSVAGSSDPSQTGLYYTRMKIGNPPRVYSVQIDTGSDILWIACNSCTDCPRTTELGKDIDLSFYDPSGSSTAALVSCSDPICTSMSQTTSSECSIESNQCNYSFQYKDESGTSGFYVSDMLYLDMFLGDSMIVNSSASIVFGCSTYQSGDLTNPIKALDGIFGLGQQSLSVISQLSSRGITPKVFSHCLKGDHNGGGILVLGEILDPSIVYSPLVPLQPHYNLYLESIAVNGKLLPIIPEVFATSGNQGTFVDSGTTLAYLVEEAYDPFVTAVTSTVSHAARPISYQGNQCYLVPDPKSLSDVFPLVSLNFAGNASMVLKPEEYLVFMGSRDGARMWCMGFQRVLGRGFNVLGDLVLKDKIFVYDLAGQRIGWANYDCSSPFNVSITYGGDKYINGNLLTVSCSSTNTNFTRISLSRLLQSCSPCLVEFSYFFDNQHGGLRYNNQSVCVMNAEVVDLMSWLIHKLSWDFDPIQKKCVMPVENK